MDVNFLMEAIDVIKREDVKKTPTGDLILIAPIIHELNNEVMSELISRNFFDDQAYDISKETFKTVFRTIFKAAENE